MIQLLTEKEVSKMLATSWATLRYWRMIGKGPDFIRLGGRIKYDLADVLKCVEAGRVSMSGSLDSKP